MNLGLMWTGVRDSGCEKVSASFGFRTCARLGRAGYRRHLRGLNHDFRHYQLTAGSWPGAPYSGYGMEANMSMATGHGFGANLVNMVRKMETIKRIYGCFMYVYDSRDTIESLPPAGCLWLDHCSPYHYTPANLQSFSRPSMRGRCLASVPSHVRHDVI
jgi:hypothetical protein